MKKTFTYEDLKKPQTILKKVMKYTRTIINFLLVLTLVMDLINFHNLSHSEKIEFYKFFLTAVIIGIIVNLNKILLWDIEIAAIGGMCGRKKFIRLIREEKFKEVKNIGDDKIFESELWIKVSGVYIPKNFIKYYYVVQGGYGVNYIKFVTIDGNYFSYSVGGITKDLENTLNTIRVMLPKAKLINGDISTTREVTKELREQFKIYLNDEFIFEDSIKL
ncbi:hypothetical protein UMC2_34221 [[Clostridium] sordellii]|uniref:hypothetical protein n=1 Tax=Paraclostridium sordellii TaxID=1505 RepID=UPI00054416E3|nr:hypothetical protein [Paeniclostridium sordellii]CEK36552.1 hypothetical protein UMC2_34221 [[Clostridium] sordellii] [Paeniclostridium sordellii]